MNFADIHAAVDKDVREKITPESAKQGMPITCRGAGCFGCCKEPVALSRAEAAYLVEGLSEEQRAHVATATRRWLQLVLSSGMLQEPEPHVLLWRSIQAWCPLLRDGQCLAYARRPLSCRVHFATGDPANCHDDKLRVQQRYVFCPNVANSATAGELMERGYMEMDNLGVWLAEMLLGKKVKSAARWTARGRVDEENHTLILDCGDMPPLDERATRVKRR